MEYYSFLLIITNEEALINFVYSMTLNKSIDKMYFGKIIWEEWSESGWRNKTSWICYIAVSLKMIQLPVLIRAGRCQNAWISLSHVQTVCFLAQYVCVYLTSDLALETDT